MAAASAASGFRTWLQTHHFDWLTPSRLRKLTLAAMCAAGLVCTVGVSGSSVPTAAAHSAAAHPDTERVASGHK
jgi:hypothetical protein